jgi:hypothetical protein
MEVEDDDTNLLLYVSTSYLMTYIPGDVVAGASELSSH